MISTLKELFAEHGIPELLSSDNDPQFTSDLFAEFATDWNFDHYTYQPLQYWPSGSSCKDCQGTTNMIQVLRTRSFPFPTCLLQYPFGCTHAFTWWDALPACPAYNSATVHLPYWPTHHCWPWPSRLVSLLECSKPSLSGLPTEGPAVCWTDHICS